MNVRTKFHDNPSSISLKNNLIIALEGSSSGNHECLDKILCQSTKYCYKKSQVFTKVLQHLEKTLWPIDRPTLPFYPRDMLPAGLKTWLKRLDIKAMVFYLTGHIIVETKPFYYQNHPLWLSFLYLHKPCGPPVFQLSPCDTSGTWSGSMLCCWNSKYIPKHKCTHCKCA